jgi:hypothetical protein
LLLFHLFHQFPHFQLTPLYFFQLIGPCEQPEINAFLDDALPSSNDKSLGRYYIAHRDEETELPASEVFKGRHEAFVKEMKPIEEEMVKACKVIAVCLVSFLFSSFCD